MTEYRTLLSNFIKKSSTVGLMKNDGTIDTTDYVDTNDSRLSDTRNPKSHTHLSSNITDLIDVIYPVGSIYMSINSTDPSTLFGGSWTRLKDTFLLACGDTYSSDGDVATSQHGSATVTLTANQSGVKSHAHTISHTHGVGSGRQFATRGNHSDGIGEKGAASGTAFYAPAINKSDNWYGAAATSTQSTTNSGNATEVNASEAHENMPPYMAVYMWKRTA